MNKTRDKDLNIENLTSELCRIINGLPDTGSKIDALNYVRSMLHEVSPLKHHPVDFVAWEHSGQVEANSYNPNSIPTPEMRLLVTSIEEDGFTMPVVTSPEEDQIRIVDGYHRRQAEISSLRISKSTYGRLPVTYIRESQRGLTERMASTIRHNRARGAHDVTLMSHIVRELVEAGRSTTWIARHIGMSQDEILRLKQLTGIAALFADKEFSMERTNKRKNDFE